MTSSYSEVTCINCGNSQFSQIGKDTRCKLCNCVIHHETNRKKRMKEMNLLGNLVCNIPLKISTSITSAFSTSCGAKHVNMSGFVQDALLDYFDAIRKLRMEESPKEYITVGVSELMKANVANCARKMGISNSELVRHAMMFYTIKHEEARKSVAI